MGDYIPEGLDVDVIGPHRSRNCALRLKKVCAESLPFMRRELIRAGGMAQVEY